MLILFWIEVMIPMRFIAEFMKTLNSFKLLFVGKWSIQNGLSKQVFYYVPSIMFCGKRALH